MKPHQRYSDAHKLGFEKQYPQAAQAGHYFKPSMPDCRTANGLTQSIVKFLLWNGHRATRISSSGRIVGKRYIPGTTRKGAADISATIKGKSVMLEIKVGKDKPSEYQLREQALERKAGGVYEFIYNFDEFILWYDNFILIL